jgi:hypothetical protein
MSAPTANVQLHSLRNAADWAAYHDIRRRVLFEERGSGAYDENHPDDRLAGNHPKVLICDAWHILEGWRSIHPSSAGDSGRECSNWPSASSLNVEL